MFSRHEQIGHSTHGPSVLNLSFGSGEINNSKKNINNKNNNLNDLHCRLEPENRFAKNIKFEKQNFQPLDKNFYKYVSDLEERQYMEEETVNRKFIETPQNVIDYVINNIILIIQILFDIVDEIPTEIETTNVGICDDDYVNVAGTAHAATEFDIDNHNSLWDETFIANLYNNKKHNTILYKEANEEFQNVSDDEMLDHKIKLLSRWATMSFIDCVQLVLKNCSALASKYIMARLDNFTNTIHTYENSNIVKHKCFYATFIPSEVISSSPNNGYDEKKCCSQSANELLLFVDNILFNRLLNSSLYFYMYGENIEFIHENDSETRELSTPQLTEYLVSLVGKRKINSYGLATQMSTTDIHFADDPLLNSKQNDLIIEAENAGDNNVYDLVNDTVTDSSKENCNKNDNINAMHHIHNKTIDIMATIGTLLGNEKNTTLLATVLILVDNILEDINNCESFIGYKMTTNTIGSFINSTAVLIKDVSALNNISKRKTTSIV